MCDVTEGGVNGKRPEGRKGRGRGMIASRARAVNVPNTGRSLFDCDRGLDEEEQGNDGYMIGK